MEPFVRRIQVVDSHTAGEPTRVVVAGGPDLGNGDMSTQLEKLRKEHDSFRSGIICEPRGSEVVVGALLRAPVNASSIAGVIFFNDVGYLGMCGHGTIGLITTLAHLGRITPGRHWIDTPVGLVETCLHNDGSVSVQNVHSYRYRKDVAIEVPEYGIFTGDIAWGGNWFFLIEQHNFELRLSNRAALTTVTSAIRSALARAGITGNDGSMIDHIELFSNPVDRQNSSRNFVLCPGASFDRSPCGTGTSAKMACLIADSKLQPGEVWRQEGILGTVFEGSVARDGDRVLPTIKGKAWITAESSLIFESTDPFSAGIPF